MSKTGVVPGTLSPVGSRPRKKWLNIVFDLNGVLCECAHAAGAKKFKPYSIADNVLCHINPTVVGSKAVFARPYLREFLHEVAQIADRVVVWSSMQKQTAELVAGHLFGGSKSPFDVLGQDSCKKIETSRGKFLADIHNTRKQIFLKVLSEQLFSNNTRSTSFNVDNTLLIDDSPEKSVCNENGNAVFLDPWNHGKSQDDFLREELAPWLRLLHNHCLPGSLRDYVESNRIGAFPLCASDSYMKHILKGMRESAANVGARYELPGLHLVIEPKPHRT